VGYKVYWKANYRREAAKDTRHDCHCRPKHSHARPPPRPKDLGEGGATRAHATLDKRNTYDAGAMQAAGPCNWLPHATKQQSHLFQAPRGATRVSSPRLSRPSRSKKSSCPSNRTVPIKRAQAARPAMAPSWAFSRRAWRGARWGSRARQSSCRQACSRASPCRPRPTRPCASSS